MKNVPGKGKGGRPPGPPPKPPPGIPPGIGPSMFPAASIGFDAAWPASAYEDVIESMTDCAFSCPISVHMALASSASIPVSQRTHVDSIRLHFVDDCDRYCELSARSSSRV